MNLDTLFDASAAARGKATDDERALRHRVRFTVSAAQGSLDQYAAAERLGVAH